MKLEYQHGVSAAEAFHKIDGMLTAFKGGIRTRCVTLIRVGTILTIEWNSA